MVDNLFQCRCNIESEKPRGDEPIKYVCMFCGRFNYIVALKQRLTLGFLSLVVIVKAGNKVVSLSSTKPNLNT